MASKKPASDLTFEKALEELEEITRKLEEGKESLENSIHLYERGVELREFCESKLKEAEGKWMVLRRDKSGEVTAEEIDSGKIPEQNEIQDTMF